MGCSKSFKKKVRNPKKYAKSKKVGHKAVSTQARKRKMLKNAAKPPSKLQKKKKAIGDIINKLKQGKK